MSTRRITLLSSAAFLALGVVAEAGPWTETGDAQTRSDVEIAVAAGLLNDITMQWPMPWTGILGQLQDDQRIAALPDDVREAVERLQAQGKTDLKLHRAHAWIGFDATSEPATVRGFDALGRAKEQGQIGYEYVARSTAVHLEVGVQANGSGDKQTLVLDDSYIAQRLDDYVIYAGYQSHWWGPGWVSALQLSTNARPMPQIGFSRIHSTPSRWPLLRWLGPWQIAGFVGVLNGPRTNKNTGFVALRFEFSPLPGLEIGLSRTTQMCGSGHQCQPFVDYFTFSNDPTHVNSTNDQGSIEIRHTGMLLTRPYALYAQFMNEDSNPIINSGTSRLYGGSLWLPVMGLSTRVTLEYANSLPSKNIFGGYTQHGGAYNNYDYVDGMRYRNRTLGFSLDSDSVLYTAQVSVIDPQRRTWSLSYHRALVSNALNTLGNVVTSSPVRFNALEAQVTVPLQWGEYRARIKAAGRWQDDQPRPKQGSLAAFEVALKFGI